jgi:dTDP-4-dehydrorhamnose 3,5-epimerase
MIFKSCPIAGMFEILAEPHCDDRGSFARIYCKNELSQAGIEFEPVQMNLSVNKQRHTLRGLHFQRPPHAEAKLVRAMRGTVWDVAVDLRAGDSFGRWHAIELDAERMNGVFLPEGVAHGFMTLSEESTILYQMGRIYEAGQACGVKWDDPDLAITWPEQPLLMSQQDKNWPLLRDTVPI